MNAHEEGHQNFFAYKITYRTINELIENLTDNTNSSSNPLKNKTNESNNTAPPDRQTSNITLPNHENITNIIVKNDSDIKNNQENNDFENGTNLKLHRTGNNYIPALVILIFATLIILKCTRD